MSIEIIDFQGEKYPMFQANGNASRFCRPFALEVCKGKGYDIGCSNNKDWWFPGAIPIDLIIPDEWHANNLPDEKVDYIHGSHVIEHILDWVTTLDYWKTRLKSGGTIFLYIPDYSQAYHRPWSNRRHVNILSPQIMKDYLEARDYKNIFVSGVDLYNAFMVMAEAK